MKKLILILLLIPVIVSAQIVNIPDANFKAYLVGNTAINTNLDSEIQVSEASAFTFFIDAGNLAISDLTGIEAFTSVTQLNCYSNSLTSLDVSGCIALQKLDCYNNSLTSLDVSNNTDLTMLWCFNNSLTSLDVRNGNNINMSKFKATGNTNLTCISVDDETWANANWSSYKDVGAIFSNDCLTVGIEDNQPTQPSITSYNKTITIKGKGTATIYNLTGQRVHHTKLTGNTSISLAKGIYLVRVTSEGRSVTEKVYLGN